MILKVLFLVFLVALSNALPPKFARVTKVNHNPNYRPQDLPELNHPQVDTRPLDFQPEPLPPAIPQNIPNPNYKPHDFELEQNRAAKYEFSSDVEDNINDLSQTRNEVRDGLNVRGSYSYSDGFYQRTVHYEADDKGYRVVKQEVTPLTPEGPMIDLTGTASVSNNAHGRHIAYKVQSVPIPGPVPKILTEV